MTSNLPASVRTPAEQVHRLVLKTMLLNTTEPKPSGIPSPAMPRIGVKRVLPPYLGEMGFEVKFHLARMEPWFANGWKILARRPEFYPPGVGIAAPEFFGAVDAIMSALRVVAVGGGIYVLPNTVSDHNIQPGIDGDLIQVTLQLSNMERTLREAQAEIHLRRLFLDWLDYDGRPITDYDRNVLAFSETSQAESDLRLAESLRPSYRPTAFETPPEPMAPHVGFQVRAVPVMDKARNSDPDWMATTAQAIGAHLGLPVVAYGRPDGCVIPQGVRTTWREGDGAAPAGDGASHLARELGSLKTCRLMLSPDSGWADLMAWLGVPVMLEMLRNPTTFESLRDTFAPRIALLDRGAPLGPQVDALLASETCLPNVDPKKSGTAKALFPWEY
ncbi:MAG: hypothetical protein JWP35_1786 [Caulobacter sp.]|nr:hypothetical protein [Caulobacter sp.]